MKILVIEDERNTADFIAEGLREQGFTVETAYDGTEGLNLARSGVFGLIVLDLMLEGIDGLGILSVLRAEQRDVSVLILTAKSDIADRVKGLNLGADDYLTKPFSFEELLARINALFRRNTRTVDPILSAGPLSLNMLTHSVTVGEQRIDLTGREYALLEFLMLNRGRAVSRTAMSDYIWNYQFDTGTNIIDVYINRLRQKIEQDSGIKLINTVRGFGYIIREDSDD